LLSCFNTNIYIIYFFISGNIYNVHINRTKSLTSGAPRLCTCHFLPRECELRESRKSNPRAQGVARKCKQTKKKREMSAANGQYNERDVDAKTNSTITAPSNSFQFQPLSSNTRRQPVTRIRDRGYSRRASFSFIKGYGRRHGLPIGFCLPPCSAVAHSSRYTESRGGGVGARARGSKSGIQKHREGAGGAA
jgi:hypothetical protein